MFPYMSAVSFLFSLLTKGLYKIRQMKLQNVWNGGNFLFYKRCSQMFFEGGVWKTNKWGETFIRHLWYLAVITEIKIQSSAVAVKWSLEVCNWVSCWWEKVYDSSYSKGDFINLHIWRLGQWWITSLDLSLHKFFQLFYFTKF